jgi:ketosteroid isomerase-like protein
LRSVRSAVRHRACTNSFERGSLPLPKKPLLLAVGIASFISAGALAESVPAPGRPAPSRSPCQAADSAAVVRVASRFHEILSTGDTAGLNALLAPDLKVIEAGAVENRQEYLAHHLAADIEFANAVKEKRTSFSYRCEGDVAWLVSTSTSTGNFGGRDINNSSGELMLLSRTRNGWKIRAIHWSSAKRQPR